MSSGVLFIPEIDERLHDWLGLPPVLRLVARTRALMRKTSKLQLLLGEVKMLGRDLISRISHVSQLKDQLMLCILT